MSLLNNVKSVIEANSHKYCSVQYIFENMPEDQRPETIGDLNVSIITAAKNTKDRLPIILKTGYISDKHVREDYKEQVAKELFQDHNDLAFGIDELLTSESGYVYAYSVRGDNE